MKIRRESGKVWIEGMENVNWGGSFFTREDSQVRCLVEALKCVGYNVSYSDVMGLSGAAFKLTMAPNLFVAEIHSEMGMDWRGIMLRIWGIDYNWDAIRIEGGANSEWRKELQQSTEESINNGIPLFYMNGEWNLLVGYHTDGNSFICKPYAGDESGYQESEIPEGFLGQAWFASVLKKVSEPVDRHESVNLSLKNAVEMANRPTEKNGTRCFGFTAYSAWIAALEQNLEDVSKHGNAFSYSQLLTSRQAAADYLRKVTSEVKDQKAAYLQNSADRYAEIAHRLDRGKDCVLWPWEENWTAENRAKEVAMLRECMEDEGIATESIQKALELWD